MSGYQSDPYGGQYGSYGQSPYQPSGPYQPYGYHPKPVESSILGIVAFGLVVLGSIGWGLPFWFIDFTVADASPYDTGKAMQAAGATIVLAGFAIFAGFVVSIISIAMNRGRVWGLVALVMSFILPWIVMYLAIILNPTGITVYR